jgi:hypothetical protein
MSSMMPILSAMLFIASTVLPTASPPSTACRAAVDAMPSVTLAFSVFCRIEALICSMLEVVSSTEAACSLDDCDSDWAVAETWPEAFERLSAAVRTSPMISPSLPTIACIAAINCPTSSLPCTSILTVRSPSASALAAATAFIDRLRDRAGDPDSMTCERFSDIRRATSSTVCIGFMLCSYMLRPPWLLVAARSRPRKATTAMAAIKRTTKPMMRVFIFRLLNIFLPSDVPG